MREQLEKIIQLTDDQSYSHAARMLEIKKLAKAALSEIEAGAASTKGHADGGKAGDTPQKQNPPPTGKVVI